MLTNLKEQPKDKILGLMSMYREDPRPTKIDLGVGVYKNAEGVTPVMRAVKAAEARLVQQQPSKAYVGLAGDPAYGTAMTDLLLADSVARERLAAVATPGGTGAVRQAFELVRLANPDVRVFVSDPTWPNHVSILGYLGIPVVKYRYFDSETRAVDFDGMMEDLADVPSDDVVLLHGCCHNPTGANLNLTQWQAVIDLINEKGCLPMIDIAYQGFGDGVFGARAVDRGKLFEEFRHLPRADRAVDRDGRESGHHRHYPGQPEPPEPAELFLSAGSRRAGGDGNPDRSRAEGRLDGRAGRHAAGDAGVAPAAGGRIAAAERIGPVRVHRPASRHVQPDRHYAGHGGKPARGTCDLHGE